MRVCVFNETDYTRKKPTSSIKQHANPIKSSTHTRARATPRARSPRHTSTTSAPFAPTLDERVAPARASTPRRRPATPRARRARRGRARTTDRSGAREDARGLDLARGARDASCARFRA